MSIQKQTARFLALIVTLVPAHVGAAATQKEAVALTIYSTAAPGAIDPDLYRPLPQASGYGRPQQLPVPGYAVVKQEGDIDLAQRLTEVRFTDVAALIDPTTVQFESLTDPKGTHVLEQNYQFDLVSTAKLMERYLNRPITLEQVLGDRIDQVSGILLSTAGGLVLKTEGGVQIVSHHARVGFPELPGGLLTKPTLLWTVATEKTGTHRTRVSYQTEGITWWADYNVVFREGKDANSGQLDVGAWVSIINQSGASYADAGLKLIAGDVHHAPQRPGLERHRMARAATVGAVAEAGFEEKAFFEYHLYTLGRPTSLPDNSTKQLELFPAVREVPVEKVLLYYGLPQSARWFFPDPATDRNLGTRSNPKVDIYLRFKNAENVGMGMPLPSGRIRVNKLDPADGTLEFIGEDTIDHTPKDEEVSIKLGSAFDVVGERKQLNFKVDTARDWMEEEIEIRLRNHKDEAVRVLVKENLYRWVNWEIREQTHAHEKVDARTVEFPVQLAADTEATVRYRVRYSW
jgi:hypothetical protein